MGLTEFRPYPRFVGYPSPDGSPNVAPPPESSPSSTTPVVIVAAFVGGIAALMAVAFNFILMRRRQRRHSDSGQCDTDDDMHPARRSPIPGIIVVPSTIIYPDISSSVSMSELPLDRVSSVDSDHYGQTGNPYDEYALQPHLINAADSESEYSDVRTLRSYDRAVRSASRATVTQAYTADPMPCGNVDTVPDLSLANTSGLSDMPLLRPIQRSDTPSSYSNHV
eukprot:jgi/Hompol1/3380/HPOL_003218-RA